MDEPAPHVGNEPAQGPPGPLQELLRLGNDFQARVTDELLRYLRDLQSVLGPAVPGTVVRPRTDLELSASGTSGDTAELRLVLENLQRVHCLLSVALTPLVCADGTVWYPETVPALVSRLLGPDEQQEIAIVLRLPPELPPGTYRGALHLQGFRGKAIPICIEAGSAA
jgi:hypothetical protein